MKVLCHKATCLLILIVFYAAASGQSESQINTIDSLKIVLKQSKSDSAKCELLEQLAKVYGTFDKETGINYYKQVLMCINDSSKTAKLLNNIGFNYWSLGDFNNGILYYKKSLSKYIELNDSARIGMLCNNIGASYWALGKWNEALKNYQRALKFRRAVNDLKGVSNVLNNIGLVYQDFGAYNKALIYHQEALEIAVEIKNINATSYSYSNIGKCYKLLNDYKAALKFHRMGYMVYKSNKSNDRNNSYFLANVGEIFNELGILDSALFYFNQSYNEAKRINNKHRVAIAEYHLGKAHLAKGNIGLAQKYLTNSFNSAVNENYINLLRDTQFALSEIEQLKGNTRKALSYFKNATVLKDSLFNKKEISDFTELTIGLIEEKEALEKTLLKENIEIQKASIHKEKIMRWLLLAVGFLLLIILIYIIRSRESIKKLNADLKKSEQKLRESNATKDKFFSILAHDLRGPINGIIGLSKILLEPNVDKSEKEHYSKIIHDSAEKTYQLLDKILTWAQSQKGELTFKKEIFNIKSLIEEIIPLYEELLRNKEIKLLLNLNPDTMVCADKNMVNTIVRNLISNAIKFTPKKGYIEINSHIMLNKGKQEFVELSVKDSGVGISSEIQSKLFTFTENISTKGTENEEGTGLGLVLCYEFVEKLGGKLWVESELNKGAVFYFTLPCDC